MILITDCQGKPVLMVGEDATVSFNYADLSTTSQPASSSVSEEPDKYTGEPDTDG